MALNTDWTVQTWS